MGTDHAKVIDAYRRTGSLRRAADELGISHETVRKVMAAKHEPTASRPAHTKRPAELSPVALRELRQHMTARQVADKYTVTIGTVFTWQRDDKNG
jgi:transposase